MYFNEDIILEIRLNELDKYVDNFVIIENNFTHSGEEKGFNFDINKFQNFKDKIIYLKIFEKPSGLIHFYKSDNQDQIKNKQILNALVIENYQRNFIKKGIEKFSDDDLILISDLDEIPDLSKINPEDTKNSILLFKQYFFHYKLNLYLKDFYFFGTKGCLKKNLISPQWIRNIKNKKYSIFRIDTIFSKKKYNNISIIEKGGWHFTNVMDEEKILYKLKSYLHHADFPEELLKKEIFLKLINEKKIMYDHSADKKSNRFENSKQLHEFDKNLLPEYLKNNLIKYSNWLI